MRRAAQAKISARPNRARRRSRRRDRAPQGGRDTIDRAARHRIGAGRTRRRRLTGLRRIVRRGGGRIAPAPPLPRHQPDHHTSRRRQPQHMQAWRQPKAMRLIARHRDPSGGATATHQSGAESHDAIVMRGQRPQHHVPDADKANDELSIVFDTIHGRAYPALDRAGKIAHLPFDKLASIAEPRGLSMDRDG